MTQAISPKSSPPNLVSRSGIPLETLEWEQIEFIPIPDVAESSEEGVWAAWDRAMELLDK